MQDLFSRWVIPTEAWPILNEMALGQQIPAGLHCIIQLFWTHAPAVSELAAAIELLLPPICTQRIERLLQPCPRCLSSILPRANWAQQPHQCYGSITHTRQKDQCCDGRCSHGTSNLIFVTAVTRDNMRVLCNRYDIKCCCLLHRCRTE